MYLYKNHYSVYYGRVCAPKRLVALGFPFDFKFSLETKERAIAVRRSQPIISAILQSLDNFHPDRDCVKEIRAKVVLSIQSLKRRFCPSGIKLESTKPDAPSSRQCDNKVDRAWQQAFIESKNNAQISNLSVHQLDQRTRYFLDYLETHHLTLSSITGADVVKFSDHLQARDQSAKTKKDYWHAAKQFAKWLTMTDHLTKNPFDGVTVSFRTHQFASEERPRWSRKQIEQLLSSRAFQHTSESFQWTTLLLIYMGLRPSESCQLRVKDIASEGSSATLTITDQHPEQKIKNKHALRSLPIHQTLIDMGFLDYVARRTVLNRGTLFDWKPVGKDLDWSKGYRVQFGRLQTTIGMPAKSRPTAYGFRHTFIDALKQRNVPEHEVAEVVGHVHPNMTYGRYGKRLSQQRLNEVISEFKVDIL
ncbi:Belongs to the 'phage' integrase family [Vibrio sp. B1FLJ16]|uniref:tyrosine-type recombinase/integrase n=1 Tax=Vibrio sp. B1FLJ16 TaxID=2751178 RepID=UPI0015F6EBBA|nr:tyrosine-type recombinase/integrase [Vibrio sp. B1FLJ16]CAD7819553.1 Belongs to the 'phage' integrase family [Vibrio sp. B1FLJ16]CAE6939380.1 Belongs to the 'phage' integrase family [Vibrio sp. B1FLJ16]